MPASFETQYGRYQQEQTRLADKSYLNTDLDFNATPKNNNRVRFNDSTNIQARPFEIRQAASTAFSPIIKKPTSMERKSIERDR